MNKISLKLHNRPTGPCVIGLLRRPKDGILSIGIMLMIPG